MKKNWIFYVVVMWAALSALLISSALWASPATDNQAVIQADRSLTDALRKADVKAASNLLDSNFAWTNAEGNTRDKNSTLKDISTFAAVHVGTEVQHEG